MSSLAGFQHHFSEYMDRVRALIEKPAATTEFNFNSPVLAEPQQNPFTTPAPAPVPTSITTPVSPYDISIKTNTYINNVPVPNQSPVSVSGYNMMNPPQQQLPFTQPSSTPQPLATAQCLPAQQSLPTPQSASTEWFNAPAAYLSQPQPYSPMDAVGFGLPGRSLSSCLQTMVPIEESDKPLLNHFFDYVIPLVFPIVEVNHGGPTRVREILNALQNNKSYLHCCLSVAAIHLKTSMGMEDQMDHDIMQHRYEAISQLCRALNSKVGNSQMQVMDATLGLIFYHSCVGLPDDYLPDITWYSHFQAVANLVKKLNYAPTQFNVSLITWIDILGSTMVGETPQFAHTYRTKHLSGTPSGLQPLMGCDDRIMYLISEIACLESLKLEGQLDDMIVRHHISALSAQIDWTEPADKTMESPYNAAGVIVPEKLTKILTALFRIGARIYLYSLIPGFDRHEPNYVNLVASVADTLQFLPTGASGFDRCLVWPLFMAGAHSISSSKLRKVLAERVSALGYLGDFGGFGRMYRVLKEVWRVSEGSTSSSTSGSDTNASTQVNPVQYLPQTRQYPHWRDIMRKNKWDYLLL